MIPEACRYFSCQVAKETGRDCADFLNCQTYKFLERYGEDYMSLGCGAMMVQVTRPSDVGLDDEINIEIPKTKCI